MQLHLLDLIHPELIAVDLQPATDEEAIRMVSALLVQHGYAGEGFPDDVYRREKTFPTGLPTQPYAVAIPHADPDNILSSAVGIGVLDQPVHFGQMGTDASTLVNAQVIFLLAIKEREKQTAMISELIRLLQTPAFLDKTVQAGSAEALFTLVQSVLGESREA